MRGRISPFAICVVLVLALFASMDLHFDFTPEVSGAVIYVGGAGPGNYSTIQAGVDAASPGDTVFVYNGTYNEVVEITKSLNLIGQSRNGTKIIGNEFYTIKVSYVSFINIEDIWIAGLNSGNWNGGNGINIDNSTVILNGIYVKGGRGDQGPSIEGDNNRGGIGLYCKNSILAIFNSTMIGGEGPKGLDSVGITCSWNIDGNAGNGSEAINASGSNITISSCHLHGGDGGAGGYGGDGTDSSEDGKKGGDGGQGGNGIKILTSNISITKSTITGGSGGIGGDGGNPYQPNYTYGGFGGHGGYGGHAILLTNSTINFSNGSMVSGYGGYGGKGGWRGGDGGHGGNAGNCTIGIHSVINILNTSVTTGKGGNGGDNGSLDNAGNGGHGGNGGTGFYIEYSDLNLEEININAGDGGLGGIGGNTTQDMAMGNRIEGGNGGKGGNGGDSIVLYFSNLTTYGIASYSGNGKNGGNGGDSLLVNGGEGGLGGDGGSIIKSYWSTLFIEKANMTAGNAGNGSYGGDSGNYSDPGGGDGGNGGNGGQLFFDNTTAILKFTNITASNGGNGGDGGNDGMEPPFQEGGDGGDGGIGGDGIHAINSNITIENSTLVCGYGGLGGTNGSGFTPGVPGSGGRNGTIDIDPSHIVLLNSLITGGNSDKPIIPDAMSSLEFRWYLHVGVENSTGMLVRNADVIVKDNANGTFEETYQTDNDGYVKWIIVTEKIITQTGTTYYTPHNVTAIIDGNTSYVVPEPWVNQSMEVISIFSGLEDYLLLDYGWNLISIPRRQTNNSLNSVLQSLSGQYDAVQWYNSTDPNNPWKHHSISKPPHLNDLKDIDHSTGFWLHITVHGGTTFLLNGSTIFTQQNITLHSGWNMVGYPSLSAHNQTAALNNLVFGTHVDSVWAFDAATQSWEEIGPADNFELGRGYWIHATQDCIWEVPV